MPTPINALKAREIPSHAPARTGARHSPESRRTGGSGDEVNPR